MADIRYTVTIDASTGAAEIKKLEGEIDKLAGTTKVTEGAARDLQSTAGKLWGQFALGNIAANAAQKGLHLIWGELKSIVNAAAESELVNARLDAALFSTGRESANLSEHFRKQAEAMMKVSTWDDEVIKGAQTMLLQLTKLDAEGLDRATKGTMGLASVFKMDLVQASELVAKWMEGNTDRLSKYGIHVKDTWTEEQKRNEIMRQLLVYYQRVLPDTETYSGRIMQLKNSYGELKEEMGRYFTENVKLDKILGEVVQGLRDFFNAGKDWRAEQEKGEKANIEWGNRIYEAAKKAGMSNVEIQRMIFQFRELSPETEEQIRLNKQYATTMDEADKKYKINADNMAWAITQGKFGQAMKEAYTKVEKEYNAALEEQARKQKAAEKGIIEYSGVLKETVKILDTPIWRTARKDIADMFADTQRASAVSFAFMGRTSKNTVLKLVDDFEWMKNQLGIIAGETAEKWRAQFAEIEKFVKPALETLSYAFNTFSSNRITNLENEYLKQKDIIQKSSKSEEEKLAAFAKLDEEFEIKRRDAKRAAFISQKAIEFSEAVMAGARAFLQALPNIPLAALVATLTAAKLALIWSQPVPLAKGAIFERPTLLPAISGQTYLAGESGREIVASPKNIRKAVLGDQYSGGRGFSKTILPINIYLGGQKIKEVLIEIVERASVEGTLKIAAKAIRQ